MGPVGPGACSGVCGSTRTAGEGAGRKASEICEWRHMLTVTATRPMLEDSREWKATQ